MQRTRIGVLRGGVSDEYEISLRSGANILKHLDPGTYIARDILLTKNMEWIMDGLLVDILTIANSVDLIWIALHGEFGEDGKIQHLFEQFHIPYTASGVLPSAFAMNKQLTKERFKEFGIRTPTGVVIEKDDDLEEAVFSIFKSFAMPVFIKPVIGGSSNGMSIARNIEQLMDGIENARKYGAVLVEECISGKEATCTVIDGQNGKVYALTPIEIIPDKDREYFDYQAKYEGKSQELCPGNFSQQEDAALRKLAVAIHKGMDLKHYSRSDFIISERGIYALEVNTLPGTTEQSLVPKSLSVSGITMPEFIDHVIGLAL